MCEILRARNYSESYNNIVFQTCIVCYFMHNGNIMIMNPLHLYVNQSVVDLFKLILPKPLT